MLHSFRVLRIRLVRLVSFRLLRVKLFTRNCPPGSFTSDFSHLVSSPAEEFVSRMGTPARAVRANYPQCAEHVANVYTFSGDRSGFLMSFHLRVSRWLCGFSRCLLCCVTETGHERCRMQTGVVSGSGHRSCAQSREFHDALATASLVAFVNEFAMSVGIALSHLWSGILSTFALLVYLSIPSHLGMGSRPGRDYSLACLRVLVFIGYMATVAWKYPRAPICPSWFPWRSWLGPQPAVCSTADIVPCSLCSHSQRSCRPQPRGVAETPLLARTQGRTSDLFFF